VGFLFVVAGVWLALWLFEQVVVLWVTGRVSEVGEREGGGGGREGGRKEGREGGRKEGREEGRKGGREEGRKRERKKEREKLEKL